MKTLFLRSLRLPLTAPALALFALTFSPLGAPAQAAGNGMGSMPMAKQQPGKPPLSPPMDADVTLAGKKVMVHYNSPQMRGRKIMGELVPYDKVWRTGANPATMFVTETDLKVGDLRVPAGKYTLYTLPQEGKPWMLIVNKQTGQWGTVYDEKQDLGRTPMHAATLPTPQEGMTISFEKVHGREAELHVRWDRTDEWVAVVAE